MAEAVAALHHLDAAAPYQFIRREILHLLAGEHDRALGDVAALGMQQIGDRLQRGGLAGAVGAQERDDAALRHRKRHALQHQDDVIVDHLDVVDREDGLGLCGGSGVLDGCHRRSSSLPREGKVARVATRAGEGVSEAPTRSLARRKRPSPHKGEGNAFYFLSQGSVRLGQPEFALAYSFAAAWISGSTLLLIGWIQSEPLVHFLPSHFAM